MRLWRFTLRPLTLRPRSMRVRHLVLIDLLLIMLSIGFSFWIRYEVNVNQLVKLVLPDWTYLLLVPIVRLPTYYVFKLYYRLWRYASTREVYRILAASSVASAFIFTFNFGILAALGLPYLESRSIWLVESIGSLMLLAGFRIALRQFEEGYHGSAPSKPSSNQVTTNVMIVGAGDAGALLLRQIQANSSMNLNVVGFVDDDSGKQNRRLHDVPVLGFHWDLPELIAQHQVKQLIIAMPSAAGKVIRKVVEIGKQAGIQTMTLPALYDLLDGKVTVQQIREVRIEDLLRREPVQTEIAAVRSLLRGRRVMVTGGGGSIGSELCRQILACQPAELVLLGHGENSIFEIYNELKQELVKCAWQDVKVSSCIADIRLRERVMAVFDQFQPQIVFHAAAHKHVPLMEENPAEAITNNVLGVRNVLDACTYYEVDRFVMISSDKAVNPTSVMGATKRVAEFLVHEAARRTKRAYVAVRFGNVLGSRGSVVLTFKKQIASGGPLTVTDPEMKRYFMTIPEAVQLVLQSATLGKGGEVFLLDMGEPIKIADLARDMIRLSGLEEGRDIDIAYSGLRPGEKLFEEMFTKDERYDCTRHSKIFIATNASECIPQYLWQSIDQLAQAAAMNDDLAIRRGLHHLIPEYRPAILTEVTEPNVADKTPIAVPAFEFLQSKPQLITA